MIPADRHFLSVSDLQSAGLSYYKIAKLVAEGKLNNRIYENTAYSGEVSDFAVVAAYAPRGILCMMTAAWYYALTTYLPDAVDIAIERSMKISTLPEWPNINTWHYPEKRYNTGVVRAHRSHRWGHCFKSSTDHQKPLKTLSFQGFIFAHGCLICRYEQKADAKCQHTVHIDIPVSILYLFCNGLVDRRRKSD